MVRRYCNYYCYCYCYYLSACEQIIHERAKEEGIAACKEALDLRKYPSIPTDEVLEMNNLALDNNLLTSMQNNNGSTSEVTGNFRLLWSDVIVIIIVVAIVIALHGCGQIIGTRACERLQLCPCSLYQVTEPLLSCWHQAQMPVTKPHHS